MDYWIVAGWMDGNDANRRESTRIDANRRDANRRQSIDGMKRIDIEITTWMDE